MNAMTSKMFSSMRTGSAGRWALRAVSVAMLMGLVVGCAQDKGDINRVQPDYTKKTWLQGEWYYRVTVSEAAVLAANTFPGNQSMLERGVFEVQEDMLHFYRTYEWATGSETIGDSADVDTPLLDENGQVVMRDVEVNGETVASPVYIYRGAPLASWPIMTHFDIKRSFNTTTGEETTVVLENTTDQKWYNRQYMRVDWGAGDYNSIDHPAVLPGATGIPVTPKSGGSANEQTVQEFENYGEDGERLMYFDVSSRTILDVGTDYLEGFGEIPLCWYYPWAIGGIYECQSEEVQLRSAFKRYEPSDFQVWEYDDEKLARFGYYRAERLTWDEKFGVTYSGTNRRAIRHRIWENYVRKEDGSLDYSQMTPKPIVYYVNEKAPRDLMVPNISLAAEWSGPFDETVEFLKGARPAHSMVILCENNLAEACMAFAEGLPTAIFAEPGKEAEACQKVGITVTPSSGGSAVATANAAFCDVQVAPKRIGDLRYNLMAAIPQQLQYGLYGFGPPSFDPLTGEIITANAYSYAAPMLRGATRALHTLEMMAGVRTFLEIESGSFVRDHVGLKRLKRSGTVASLAYDLDNFGKGGMDASTWSRFNAQGLPQGGASAQASLARIKERPDLEQLMIAPEFRRHVKDPSFVGKDPVLSGDMPEFAKEMAAPRNWATVAGRHDHEKMERGQSLRCEYTESFVDSALLGMVREYGERYNREFCTEFEGKFGKVFDWSEFTEIGGPCKLEGAVDADGMVCRRLTQEFESGAQLRWTNVCTVEKLIAQMRNSVEELEGIDPYQMYQPGSPAYENSKREELNEAISAFRGKLDEMRDSSVVELWQMIYRGVQLHEMGHNFGLRHNFEASTDALNFGEEYWKLKLQRDDQGTYRAVNLWQPDTLEQSYMKMRELESASVMEYTRKFNGRNNGLGLYDHAAIKYGYGQLVEVFDNAPDMASLEPYTHEPSEVEDGNQSVLGPARTPLEGALRKLHHSRYVSYFGNDIGNFYARTVKRLSDVSASDVEVPYRFCSDEYAGMTPTCQRHDEGVDPYEVAQRHAENYENYWPLEGYAFDSVAWSASNYANGVARYFYEMRKQFQHWVQLKTYYDHNNWWADNIGNGKAWDEDINGGLTYKEAAKLSFNVMANAFGRPGEARYGLNQCNGRYEPIFDLSLCQYSKQRYITQEESARPFYEAFDFQGYLYTPYRSGAIYDRIFAFAALTDPTVRDFLNVEEVSDSARYRVNYYSVWPDEMTRLMGGLMTSDEAQYGWWICGENENPNEIRPRDYFAKGAPSTCWRALNPEPQSAFANAKYRMPALAALHGMALMTDNYNKSFIDASRICLEGSGECMEYPAGTEVARFPDPLSGKVYVSTRFGDANDYDPAFELVTSAANAFSAFTDENGEIQLDLLEDEYYFSELQFLTGRLELVRGMRQVYGGGL